MEETIRGRADWGDSYIAFTNYDLQVLDVSEYLEIKYCNDAKFWTFRFE